MKHFFLIGAVAALTMSSAVVAVSQDNVGGPPQPSQNTLGQLRQENRRLEDQAARMLQSMKGRDSYATKELKELKEAVKGSGFIFSDDDDPTEKLTDLFKKTVTAAFEARQRLQEAEVAERREQLRRIERSIQSHERSKDEIIEHRIKELLDPRLRWESDKSPDSSSRDGAVDPETPSKQWSFTVTKGDVAPLLELLKTSHPDVDFYESICSDEGNRIVPARKTEGEMAQSDSQEALRIILRTIVQDEFDKRQELLQEELESLRKRLDAIEEKIASRDADMDLMIERGVEELLKGKRRVLDDRPESSASLEGVWEVTGREDLDFYYWQFDTKAMKMSTRWKRDNKIGGGENRFTIDTSKTPHHLTIYGANMLSQAIFEMDGNHLLIAGFGRPESARPESFEDDRTDAGSLAIFRLRRVQSNSRRLNDDSDNVTELLPSFSADESRQEQRATEPWDEDSFDRRLPKGTAR